MKKMLFTAIALVAFAGTSMANTKEEKKPVNITKKVVPTTCQQLAIAYYEYIMDTYGSGRDDAGLLNRLMYLCQ